MSENAIFGFEISDEHRVGKCSYISCSYVFLYYIRKLFVEAKCSYIFLYYSH